MLRWFSAGPSFANLLGQFCVVNGAVNYNDSGRLIPDRLIWRPNNLADDYKTDVPHLNHVGVNVILWRAVFRFKPHDAESKIMLYNEFRWCLVVQRFQEKRQSFGTEFHQFRKVFGGLE